MLAYIRLFLDYYQIFEMIGTAHASHILFFFFSSKFFYCRIKNKYRCLLNYEPRLFGLWVPDF